MKKSDNKPREPEMGYFNLINSILDVLIEFSLDLSITYINPQVYEVFGYYPDELIGKKTVDFIHSDDMSRAIEAIKRTIESREIFSTELRIRHKKGHFVPTYAKGRLVEHDTQDRIIAVLRNITEIKDAKQNLKESDQKYREIIENIEDGYFEVDLQGNYTYVNNYICKYLGFSRKKLIGKSYAFTLDNKTLKEIYDIFNLVYEKNLPKGTIVSKVIRNDGQERTFEGSFYLRYDATGKKVGFYGFTRDITERKKNEEKLKESEEKFRIISEQSLVGITITQDNLIKYVNQPYAESSGYTIDEIMNWKPGEALKLILPEDRKTVMELPSKYQTDNKELQKPPQYRVVNKSGEVNWVEMISNIITYEGKDAYLNLFVNITERKKAEQKLKESEEKYRKAYNRAELYKDLFYHDINNILSNIKLSIELSETYLSKPEKENEIKNIYNLINNQFARGTRLIENVRKLSSLNYSLESLKSMDAMKLLEDAIDFIKTSMQTRDIKIRIKSSEKKINVRTNEFLIDIFDNLLINAANYNENPKKEILIKISRKSKEKTNYVKFEFIDNGIGISDKRKEVIFQERFSKEKGSKGMGFGLTLVKKILESYSGEIWIEDRVKGDYSKGSNFVFLIPEVLKN